MSDDVTIPREMAKDIANYLRYEMGRVGLPMPLAGYADLLDPPPPSLRDEVAVAYRDEIIGVSRDSWDEVAEHAKLRAYEFADAVLAVVRKRIEGLPVGAGGCWSAGCADVVLALLGDDR